MIVLANVSILVGCLEHSLHCHFLLEHCCTCHNGKDHLLLIKQWHPKVWICDCNLDIYIPCSLIAISPNQYHRHSQYQPPFSTYCPQIISHYSLHLVHFPLDNIDKFLVVKVIIRFWYRSLILLSRLHTRCPLFCISVNQALIHTLWSQGDTHIFKSRSCFNLPHIRWTSRGAIFKAMTRSSSRTLKDKFTRWAIERRKDSLAYQYPLLFGGALFSSSKMTMYFGS